MPSVAPDFAIPIARHPALKKVTTIEMGCDISNFRTHGRPRNMWERPD
jgi:hypothetical protein